MSNKRYEIISVTAELIHSKGYETTKLSDIMAASGIGKGQFYHYFSSKRDLGIAVVDHFVENWERDLLQGILNTEKPAAEKLDKMLEWAVGYHDRKPVMCGCPFGNLALEMSEHDEVFRKKINVLFDKWIDALEPVVGHLCEETDARLQAQSLVAQIEGGIMLMKNYQDITILKEIIETIRLKYLDNKKGEGNNG